MNTTPEPIWSPQPEHLEAANALSYLPLDLVAPEGSGAPPETTSLLSTSEALFLIQDGQISQLLEATEGPAHGCKMAIAGLWDVYQSLLPRMPGERFYAIPSDFQEGTNAREVLESWLEIRTKAGEPQNPKVPPGMTMGEVHAALRAEAMQLCRYLAAQGALLKAWLA